jgi:hypothetical protein
LRNEVAPRVAAFLVIAAGIIWTGWIVARIPAEVFFSGDGALKALHARQHLSQGFSETLELDAEPWVRELWSGGLYPFKPPFVYEQGSRYVVGFPFLFALVTAPFYAAAGFRGLYALPLISLWLLWLVFLRHCRALGLGWFHTAVGLAVLVIASPLTLYGAVYWEHVPAVLLAFFGLVVFVPASPDRGGPVSGALCGIAAGLSVWLRPENFCLIAILLPAGWVFTAGNSTGRRRFCCHASGVLLAVLAFFAANQAIYAHPLGAHSRQILGSFSIPDRLGSAFGIFVEMARGLVLDYPAVLVAVALAPFLFVEPGSDPRGRHARLLAIAGASLLLLVPFLVPNAGGKQLGPRYLLLLAPIVALLLPLGLQRLERRARGRVKIAFLALIAISVAAGGYRNAYVRTRQLQRDYAGRVAPTLRVVGDHPLRYVVVPNQWTAQELESLFGTKVFFHTPRVEDSVAVANALARRGIFRFLAVLHYEDSAPPYLVVPEPSFVERIEFRSLGLHGSFRVIEAVVRPRRRDPG